MLRTTIVLPGPRRVWLEVVQGVVVDASQPFVAVAHDGSDEHVFLRHTSSLRSERLGPNTVHVCKIWLRSNDGKESAHDLTSFPVDLRIGHEIALIRGAAEGVREGAYFGAWNLTSGKFAFDASVGAERLRPMGLHIPAGFFRNRLAWGGIAGVIIGSVYALLTGEVPVTVLGGILGSVLSLPLAAIEAALEKRRGRKLVPRLNNFALAILIARS